MKVLNVSLCICVLVIVTVCRLMCTCMWRPEITIMHLLQLLLPRVLNTVCHWTLSIQLYWLANNGSSCLSSCPRFVGICFWCPSFLFECWSCAMGLFSKKGETELTFLQLLIRTILMLKAFIYNRRYSLQNSIKSSSFKCVLFTKKLNFTKIKFLKG